MDMCESITCVSIRVKNKRTRYLRVYRVSFSPLKMVSDIQLLFEFKLSSPLFTLLSTASKCHLLHGPNLVVENGDDGGGVTIISLMNGSSCEVVDEIEGIKEKIEMKEEEEEMGDDDQTISYLLSSSSTSWKILIDIFSLEVEVINLPSLSPSPTISFPKSLLLSPNLPSHYDHQQHQRRREMVDVRIERDHHNNDKMKNGRWLIVVSSHNLILCSYPISEEEEDQEMKEDKIEDENLPPPFTMFIYLFLILIDLIYI